MWLKGYLFQILTVLGALGLSACVHNPCQPTDAFQNGRQDALAWSFPDAGARSGGSCKPEYNFQAYRHDYEQAFKQSIPAACSPDKVRGEASDAASLGNEMNTAFVQKYCGSEAVTAYRSAFKAKACNRDSAISSAESHASSFSEMNYSFLQKYCDHSTTEAYRIAYKNKLDRVCTPSYLQNLAMTDVDYNNNHMDGVARHCNEAAVYAYRSAYMQAKEIAEMRAERERIAQERRARKEERRQARQRRKLHDALVASCRVDNRRAIVTVVNHSKSWISTRTRWVITYYDRNGSVVDTDRESEYISASSGGTDTFEDNIFGHHNVTSCSANLLAE